MRLINKFSKIIAASAVILALGGCSLLDLDVNKDPNNPTSAAANLLLPQIQIDILGNTFGFLEDDMGIIMGLQDVTSYNWNNASYAGTWNFMYSSPLKDLEQLIAATGEKSPTYYGIALTLKAYAYMSLVDLYGDLPFSEAGLGDSGDKKVIYPKFDKDAEVYTACLKLLDDAIAQLAKPSPVTVSGDYIYGGSAAKWSRLAKSLKLKFLMTARKGISGADAQIKSLIAAGGFISGAGDDFKFTYSKDINSLRSPYFGAYTNGGDGGAYQNQQLMIEMLDDGDPRFAFYFRRQYSKILNQADPTERGATTCTATAPCKYGYFPLSVKVWNRLFIDKGKTPTKQDTVFLAGLFGRERGDVSGVPQDGSFRTIPGVYPGGGYADFPYNTPAADIKVPAANAAPGGGIFPALTEVNIMYYQLENILLLGGGTVADAKKLFESAISTHISRVIDFGAATDATYAAPLKSAFEKTDTVSKYVKKWLDRFDAATTNENKMNVVAKQLWFSSIGNGFEIFNLYRRTKLPTTIDEPIAKTTRDFPKRLPYSQTELTLNPNAATYKSVAFDKDPVFWEK